MTLALLLTAVTGAWAEETPLVTIYASSDFTSGSKTFDNKVTATFSGEVYFMDTKGWCGLSKVDKTLTVEPVDGITITRVKFYTSLGNAEDIKAPFEASMNTSVVNISGDPKDRYHVSVNGSMIGAEDTHNYLQKIEVYGTAEPPIVVEPGEAANTWTFTQPGSDVVLTPIYAKAAAFATESTGSEEKTLLPEAAEGVIAGTDASLIAEGTGIVATTTIGETTTAQGTVMYYVGTSAPTIGSDDWTKDVPTAKTVADDGAEVKVWYYIQGADAPQGEAATLDNTFNDSEVSSLTVTVLSNKFDLALKAANANTINATEASKGSVSVKVGDAAAVDKTKDITDGKLTAVKMGSEVKLNTKAGYKFRKVEVKKAVVAEGHALTSAKFGEIVCSDGKAYAAADKDNLPNGVKAEALVCYASGEHGLALAMVDVKNAKMSWDNERGANDGKTAAEWCTGWNTSHPITGATWLLASRAQWNVMIDVAGSASNLSSAFSAVGGTNLQADSYWSSTTNVGASAWRYHFPSSSWSWTYLNQDNTGSYIRACLEW